MDVKHIAKLANLNLSDEELTKFQVQLSSILDYIEKLQKLDVKNIQPTSQVTGLKNITSEDKTTPSLTQDTSISSAKKQKNGCFETKAIF